MTHYSGISSIPSSQSGVPRPGERGFQESNGAFVCPACRVSSTCCGASTFPLPGFLFKSLPMSLAREGHSPGCQDPLCWGWSDRISEGIRWLHPAWLRKLFFCLPQRLLQSLLLPTELQSLPYEPHCCSRCGYPWSLPFEPRCHSLGCLFAF